MLSTSLERLSDFVQSCNRPEKGFKTPPKMEKGLPGMKKKRLYVAVRAVYPGPGHATIITATWAVKSYISQHLLILRDICAKEDRDCGQDHQDRMFSDQSTKGSWAQLTFS